MSAESAIAGQYQNFPYPHRNVNDEHHRVCMPMGESLEEIAHFLFQGRLPRDFRVLVAGGGVGDNVVYLAEQLRDWPAATIVYVDLCEPSLKIARARAKIRGLADRIHWLHASIYDLPNLSLAPFDFITCTGVLHHLEDPEKGLAVLTKCLKPETGGMHLMVYAKYGRAAIYQIQDLMRLLLPPGLTPRQRLDQGRQIVAALPKTHPIWLPINTRLFGSIPEMADAEFYDLFLNERDRAYSVPELQQWLGTSPGSPLHLVAFSEPANRVILGLEPAIQEARHGAIIIKHAFYVSLSDKSMARLEDVSMTPFFFRFDAGPLMKALQNPPEVLTFSVITQPDMPPISLRVENPATYMILLLVLQGRNPRQIFPIQQLENALTPLINAGLVLLRRQ